MLSPLMLAELLGFVYLLNVPFGYWRGGVRKFSLGWFLAVHLPVPVVVLVRLVYGVGLELIPVFVLFYFLGQFSGGRIRGLVVRRLSGSGASLCLLKDLYLLAFRRRGDG